MDLTGAAKDQMIISLAAMICGDSKVDVSVDNLKAVVTASGNSAGAGDLALYASCIEKAGGVDFFFVNPGASVAGTFYFLF